MSDAAAIDGLGISVSAGGMYLFAIADLAVGSQVNLEFQPPQARQAVHVTGTIKHRTVYLYGVEFDQNSRNLDSQSVVAHT
jgi:hypothetical protein